MYSSGQRNMQSSCTMVCYQYCNWQKMHRHNRHNVDMRINDSSPLPLHFIVANAATHETDHAQPREEKSMRGHR